MTILVSQLGWLRREPLPVAAVAGGVSGLLAAIPLLPPGARAVLLLAFVGAGPGSALLQFWSGRVPALAQRALAPVLGLAAVVIVVSGALLLGYWSPRVVLFTLAAATCVLGVVGLGQRRRSAR